MKVLCDVHIARKVVRFLEAMEIEAVHNDKCLIEINADSILIIEN